MKSFAQFQESLTKTEQDLLDQAKLRGHVSNTVEYMGKGKVAGSRKHAAIHSLIQKGHLVPDHAGSGSDHEFTKDKARRKKLYHTLSAHLAPVAESAESTLQWTHKQGSGVHTSNHGHVLTNHGFDPSGRPDVRQKAGHAGWVMKYPYPLKDGKDSKGNLKFKTETRHQTAKEAKQAAQDSHNRRSTQNQ